MPPVLILAHGQPSAPQVAAAELSAFAARVSQLLPERRVLSATLAEPEALGRAVAELGPGGRVFPMFMAGGWFTRVQIPQRLRAAGAVAWQVLEPFGCEAGLQDLAVQIVREAGRGEAGAVEVILAAHGSFKSPVPAAIAQAVAARIARETGAMVRAGFIDQSPQIETIRGFGTLCLPFFAAAGGHVTEDIPAALAKAGFAGRILPPIGLDPRAAALVARAIAADQPVCPQACRFAPA
jgi:sirohydrochlorin ferrochelatase